MDKRTLLIFFSTILLAANLVSLSWIINAFSYRVQASSLPDSMPVVFVDPPNVTAHVDEEFTISVKVFNLSNSAYLAEYLWVPGEDLPPPGMWANYSLGNLNGIDVQLSWDPEVLEYVSHQRMIPVEEYADGLLHEPIIEVMDDVDINAGTYWMADASLNPAPPFNKPDDNATVFDMTFRVKMQGQSPLTIEEASLAVAQGPGYDDFNQECPHWVIDGVFETEMLATRLDTLEVGTLIYGSLHEPLITGEDATVRVNVTNDAPVADVFNLSIAKDTVQLNAWQNISIDAGETIVFNHTIVTGDLGLGFHTVSATVTSDLLKAGGVDFDNSTSEFRVIDTPTLDIEGPTAVMTGSSATFSALASVHNDPGGEIWNYTWILLGPGEQIPRVQVTGGSELVTYTFGIRDTWPTGYWKVVLMVEDNFGLKYWYSGHRPATAPYREVRFLIVEPIPLNITAVSQDPPGEIILPDTLVMINAEVEAYLSDVQSVTLKYTIINSTGTYVENLDMVNPIGNTWFEAIPKFPQGTEIVYTITARDYLGNSVTTEEIGYQLGYEVIPEFPTWAPLLLLLIVFTVTITICGRRLSKKIIEIRH